LAQSRYIEESLSLRVAQLEGQLTAARAEATSPQVSRELTASRLALSTTEERLRTEAESCRHLAAAVAHHREESDASQRLLAEVQAQLEEALCLAEEQRGSAESHRLASERALALAAEDHEATLIARGQVSSMRDASKALEAKCAQQLAEAEAALQQARQSEATAEARARRAEEAQGKAARDAQYRLTEASSRHELKVRSLREALEQAERRAEVAQRMDRVQTPTRNGGSGGGQQRDCGSEQGESADMVSFWKQKARKERAASRARGA